MNERTAKSCAFIHGKRLFFFSLRVEEEGVQGKTIAVGKGARKQRLEKRRKRTKS